MHCHTGILKLCIIHIDYYMFEYVTKTHNGLEEHHGSLHELKYTTFVCMHQLYFKLILVNDLT